MSAPSPTLHPSKMPSFFFLAPFFSFFFSASLRSRGAPSSSVSLPFTVLLFSVCVRKRCVLPCAGALWCGEGDYCEEVWEGCGFCGHSFWAECVRWDIPVFFFSWSLPSSASKNMDKKLVVRIPFIILFFFRSFLFHLYSCFCFTNFNYFCFYVGSWDSLGCGYGRVKRVYE